MRGNSIRGLRRGEPRNSAAGASGAYGLRIAGVRAIEGLLSPVEPDAPLLTVEQRRGRPAATETVVGEQRARLALFDHTPAVLEMTRVPLTARFVARRPWDDDALVHPLLSLAAAAAAYWLGRDAFHAGAVILGGEAWAVLGDKDAGKSSVLCHLAGLGRGILADDLLVVDGERALAGPNSIDLRPGAAHQLGVGDDLGVVGGRERWRVLTAPTDPSVRLAGWISLAWGDELALAAVPPAERMTQLLSSRTLPLPASDPARLLRLAALPAWRLTRPREWSSLAAGSDLLLDRLAA